MTELPIDYHKRPWKPKYIDQETELLNRWMIFGEYTNGTVCISDCNGLDIFEHVPRKIAEEILVARDNFIEIVLKHFADWTETQKGTAL